MGVLLFTSVSAVSLWLGWGDVLSSISPYAWGSMGVAAGLAFSIVGAAWCVCGTMKRTSVWGLSC
jgi:hypothetical protein